MDAVHRGLLMRGGLEGGSTVSSNLIKHINFQVPKIHLSFCQLVHFCSTKELVFETSLSCNGTPFV